MQKIQLIILNYNNAQDTIKLVNILLNQQNINYEITVVDNFSPDNSYEKLDLALNKIKKVKVIKSSHNGGYAYGNNFGLHFIENENPKYVAILNNDLIIDDSLLFSKLIEAYENLDDVGFIAPAQNTNEGKLYNHSAWRKPSFFQDLLSSFWLYRRCKRSNTYDLSTVDKVLPVEILPGSFLFTSYDYFKDIGFFDEGTFLFLEERILYDKTKKVKKQNYLIKDLFYMHEASLTIDQEFSNVDKYKILYQSLLYYTKNYRKFGKFKCIILWPFLQYSLFELKIMATIKKLVRKRKLS